MREDTVTTKVYSFAELSESAKENAIQELSDINTDYEWWDSEYEDAANVGIKITGFDLGRGSFCRGSIDDVEETANKIIAEHGESCETYKTAANYLKDRRILVEKYSDGTKTDEVAEDNDYDFDQECDDLDDEFKKSILEDYRIMLQKQYEYLCSEEAIIETIEANEYEFTEDGKLY